MPAPFIASKSLKKLHFLFDILGLCNVKFYCEMSTAREISEPVMLNASKCALQGLGFVHVLERSFKGPNVSNLRTHTCELQRRALRWRDVSTAAVAQKPHPL